jgi:glutaredoxin
MTVKIYTTATCAYCRAEKAFLDAKSVKYEEVAVDADPAAAEEMIKLSGQMGVPVTHIVRDDGSAQLVIGFDQARLTEALGLDGNTVTKLG